MGRFAWENWALGLVSAFLSAGSGAVSTAFGTMVIAPDQFNLQHPLKLFEMMAITFCFSGAMGFFTELHTHSLPAAITTTTTETLSAQKTPPALVKTTVTEVKESDGEPIK